MEKKIIRSDVLNVQKTLTLFKDYLKGHINNFFCRRLFTYIRQV